MQTVMESTMYLKEDIEALFEEIIKKSSWSKAEMAKSIREDMKKLPVFYMAVQKNEKP